MTEYLYKWEPITPITTSETEFDFSEIDSLQQQWLEVKEQVESSTPQAYEQFLDRLGRSWAIETGIIEGVYTLDIGVTETLVEHGIIADYIERSSTNKEPEELVQILKDHQDSIRSVYQWISEGRPLTKWFIRALHEIITRNQHTFRAIDQFGNYFDAQLHKGVFKQLPNNPTRPDGYIHEYCPPEQVESEMDNLVSWHEQYQASTYHPLLVAAWLHHRFTQIHPFQDGNGRVVRTLLTWHLVRKNFLPIVISRDMRSRYIEALEKADKGSLNSLVELIVQLEKDTILKAISVGQPELSYVGSQPLVDQVIDGIVERIERQRLIEVEQRRSVNTTAIKLRQEIKEYLDKKSLETRERLWNRVRIRIDPIVDEWGQDKGNEYWYKAQVVETARKAGHWVNFTEPRYFVKVSLNPSIGSRNPRLSFVVSLHNIGRELTGIMAATSFAQIEFHDPLKDQTGLGESETSEFFRDCTVNPFTFTWKDSPVNIRERFIKWTEECFSIALSYWGEFLAGSSEY